MLVKKDILIIICIEFKSAGRKILLNFNCKYINEIILYELKQKIVVILLKEIFPVTNDLLLYLNNFLLNIIF